MSCCFTSRNCCQRRVCSFPSIVPLPPPPVSAGLIASVASFTLTPSTQVASNATLPIIGDFSTDTSNYSLSSGVVTLKKGNYIASFDGDATVQEGKVNLALTLNGAVVPKSQSSAWSDDNGGVALSSLFILNVPSDGSAVALRNTGAAAAQFANVNLVLQKLNS